VNPDAQQSFLKVDASLKLIEKAAKYQHIYRGEVACGFPHLVHKDVEMEGNSAQSRR